MTGNVVTGNTGGIYLTDESGPAAHNVIADNRVLWNLVDCGITLASHSDRAVSASGQVKGRVGGVYDNTITHNVAESNGVRLPGAAMAVTDDSEVAGSVSGGCVEGAVLTEALDVLSTGSPKLLTYGISDDDAFAVGLTCGGTIHVFVEALDW